MMNGRGWIEGKVVESTEVGRASAEEQASNTVRRLETDVIF
jgi:hypothetical protein